MDTNYCRRGFITLQVTLTSLQTSKYRVQESGVKCCGHTGCQPEQHLDRREVNVCMHHDYCDDAGDDGDDDDGVRDKYIDSR